MICGLLLFGFLLPLFSATLILPHEAYAADVGVSSTGAASIKNAFENARGCSGWNPLNWINLDCIILNVIWAVDNFLLGWLLDLASELFNWSVEKNLTDITDNAFVTTGWGIVRDITNLFFIFILLWIALATIFNIPRYGAKDLLATLIISALLINFSLAIGGFFIKFSNALALTFHDAIRARGSVTLQLLDFTNIQKFTLGTPPAPAGTPSAQQTPTTPPTPQRKDARCKQFAEAIMAAIKRTDQNAATWDTRYNEAYKTCANDPTTDKILENEVIDLKVKEAINIALWLIILIPILIFVFLAGAVFFLIRYLQLAILLVFSPIVFLFWILPDTKHIWSDWWNRLIKQSFFAPAYLFLLFLTITTFNQWSGRTIVSSGTTTAAVTSVSPLAENKEPPLLKNAAIGGLGTGLRTQEALAEVTSPAPKPKSNDFFTLGFEMVLFVALMIMNLMVAQQMGIKFAGTVTGWGSRATRWGGRKVRGAAYRQAIRAGTGAARGVTESALGRAMARTPGFRALLTPAVAIQKQREAIDADRAKRVAELAQVSPVAAAERLQGESMAVKAAYAKSASPEAMRKILGGMTTKNPDGSNNYDAQEEYVRQMNENADRYRIEDLDKKVGEAMAKDPRGLTLRTVAKTGASTSDPNFQQKVNSYLAGLDDREFAQTMTAKTIEENPYAQNYIVRNFKDERRIGNAVLGTPEKITAFKKLISKLAEEVDHGLTLPFLPPDERSKKEIEYASTAMENAGNHDGATALATTPILEVLAGAGVRKFTREDYQPPIGACCLPTGNCVITTSVDCRTQGGSFMGIGVPCTPGLCSPTTPPPPPPPQPGPPPPGGPPPPTPPAPPPRTPPRTPPPPTTPPTTPRGPTPPTPPAPPSGGALPSAATAGLSRRGLPPLPAPPALPPPTTPPPAGGGLPSILEAAMKRRGLSPLPQTSPTTPSAPITPSPTPPTPTPPAGTVIPPTTPTTRTPRQKTTGVPAKADPNDLAAFSRNLAAALNERVANQLTPLVENMDRINAAVATISQEIGQGTLNSENARRAIKTLTQEIKDMRPRGAVQNDSRETLTKIMARIRRIEETSRSIAESVAASDEDANKETASLLRGLHDASSQTRLALARKRGLLPS
ncbi:MAG: hypothetical protein HYW90_02295 [Candidatus Sungbacteria bacterium]|nr:hypothetical protein [Candidatus Sungbacteria bacterium]